MNVQVRVSEQGALRNGRFAFTDKLTLVSELLQNARRAGATEICIEFDEASRVLVVSDDGHGIHDFQHLLTFNESGWEGSIIEAEHAFGVGFSKALYAAERVLVSSRGKRLEFDTADALAQRELAVIDDASATPGRTVVRLAGVDLPRLDQQVGRMVRGFPIPVVFNGVTLDRPHAIGARSFRECDIGRVSLCGSRSGTPATGTAIYLQGLLVDQRDYYCDNDQVDVIHLDSLRFLARLPDRRELIDHAEKRRTIDAAVRALWRVVLSERKAELSPHDFTERFFRIARCSGNVDLFDDVDLLPRQCCLQVVGYPIFDQDHGYLEHLWMHIDRTAVERGDVLLAEIDSSAEDDLPRWMFARARGYVIVETGGLSEFHWSRGYVRDLSNETCTISAVARTHMAEFDGRWICPMVSFCGRVELKLGADAVDIVDDAVYDGSIVHYPALAAGGEVARQISDYVDEHERFDRADSEADTEGLADFVRRMRSTDPSGTLLSLMRDLSLDRYPLLAGRTFRLAVGASGNEHSVELVS